MTSVRRCCRGRCELRLLRRAARGRGLPRLVRRRGRKDGEEGGEWWKAGRGVLGDSFWGRRGAAGGRRIGAEDGLRWGAAEIFSVVRTATYDNVFGGGSGRRAGGRSAQVRRELEPSYSMQGPVLARFHWVRLVGTATRIQRLTVLYCTVPGIHRPENTSEQKARAQQSNRNYSRG